MSGRMNGSMGSKIATWLLGVGILVQTLQATPPVQAQTPPHDKMRSFADALVNPFVDPLWTRPDSLKDGTALPNDRDIYACPQANLLTGEEAKASLDTTQPLTLMQAVDMALCHNPQVQGAWSAIKVQAAGVGEARAAYFPTLSVGMSRMRDKTVYPESQFLVESERLSNTRYTTLSWRLLDFGTRGANRRAANALLDAALASRDAVLQKTLAGVISAYFDAQTAFAVRAAKVMNEALAQQTLETAQRREARGMTAQSDVLQATTALAKAALEKSRAQGAYAKAMSVLVYALGLSPQTLAPQTLASQTLSPQKQGDFALTLSEDLTDTEDAIRQDLGAWLTQAQAQHPSLVAARAQVESAKEKVTATRAEGLPTLDLTSSIYLNGRPNQGLSSAQSEEKMAGFTLNFPLFEGFSRTYKIRGAQAQVEVKEADLRDTQNQVLIEVVKAHADALASLNNLGASKQLIEAAHNAQSTVKRRYTAGAADITEMLTVQLTLSDAQMERIRALAEWRSARLRLVANAGVLGRGEIGSSARNEGSAQNTQSIKNKNDVMRP